MDCEIKNIGLLFQLSEKFNRVWELELICRSKALETAYEKMNPPYNKKLFLNVNPNVMSDENFKKGFTSEYLERYGVRAEDIIFEITERTVVYDINNFKKVIEHYKNQSYQIAIDDVGAGYSGLNLIANVHPHYIKLDMELIRHIDTDYTKKAVIKSMVVMAQLLNIKLIAEGIETSEELKSLIELGVHYGQGYYIQKPHQKIMDIREHLINEIAQNYQKFDINSEIQSSIISDLCVNGVTVPPQMKSEDLSDLFRTDEKLAGVCINDRFMPRGIITKTNFFLYFGSRYGYSLNKNKVAKNLMDKDFLKVDYKTSILEVTKLAMARDHDKVYDFIVVTKEEKYLGIVTIKDLLENARHSEVIQAKNQNPLTGLPGNMMVDQAILQTISLKERRSIMYIDIDNFKVYNDVYGFKNGDLIIKLLANIMMRYKSSGDFIGHIGGDDFIMICDEVAANRVANQIIESFEDEIKHYYSEEDLKRGYIIGKDREGNVDQFAIASISVAGIMNQCRAFSSLYDLTEELAKVKKQCKLIKGSCYIQRDESQYN